MPILPANSHRLLNGCEPHTRGWQSSSVHRPAVIVDERGAVQRSNSNCTFSIQINNLPFDKALTVHHTVHHSLGIFALIFSIFGQAMPTNTYSDRVNIIKYVKLDEGWRFAPLARKPNGNIRWDTVLIEGVEMRHPEGRFSSSGAKR